MKNQIVIIGIAVMLICIGLSGCEEEKKISDILKITIDNLTSYHINVDIKIIGEDFSYNRQITIQKDKTNITKFNMEPKEQDVTITLTATYVDTFNVSDTKTGEWLFTPTGEDWSHYYKVYGSADESTQSISISGPL